jgi:hypothetical protein
MLTMTSFKVTLITFALFHTAPAARVLQDTSSPCTYYYSSDSFSLSSTAQSSKSSQVGDTNITLDESNAVYLDQWRNNPTENLYGYYFSVSYSKNYQVIDKTTGVQYYAQNMYYYCSASVYNPLVTQGQSLIKKFSGTSYISAALNKTKTISGSTTSLTCSSNCNEYRPESGWVLCDWSAFPNFKKMEYTTTLLPTAKSSTNSNCMTTNTVTGKNQCQMITKNKYNIRQTSLDIQSLTMKFTQTDNLVRTFPFTEIPSVAQGYATMNSYNSSNYYSICNGGCYIYG